MAAGEVGLRGMGVGSNLVMAKMWECQACRTRSFISRGACFGCGQGRPDMPRIINEGWPASILERRKPPRTTQLPILQWTGNTAGGRLQKGGNEAGPTGSFKGKGRGEQGGKGGGKGKAALEEGNGKGTERLGARPKATAKAGAGKRKRRRREKKLQKRTQTTKRNLSRMQWRTPSSLRPPPAQGPTGSEDCRAGKKKGNVR